MPSPNEIEYTRPTVFVNGEEVFDLVAESLETNIGITPSKLLLRHVPPTIFETSRVALGAGYAYGRRVVVKLGETVIFSGYIMDRADQGAADAIYYWAYDDRILLERLWLPGAIVRDKDGTGFYSPRHPPIINPGGAWNCTGIDIGGETWPVFAPVARLGSDYEAPEEAHVATLPTDGSVAPWTPRRLLRYCCLLTKLQVAAYRPKNWNETTTGALSESSPIIFDQTDITESNMIGKDAPETVNDPLDRKATTVDLSGQSLLGAIVNALDIAGTHTLRIKYTALAADGTSTLDFVPTGWSAFAGGKTLRFQTGGYAGGASGIQVHDFLVHRSAREVFNAVTVLGAVSLVETRVTLGDGLKKGWNDAEEAAFLRCIWGCDPGGTALYAQIPKTFGPIDGTVTTWVTCDGTNGAPLAHPGSSEAISLARTAFPTVFRAYRLDSSDPVLNGILENVATTIGGSITGGGGQPAAVLEAPRPVLPDQLQYMVRNMDASTTGKENRLSQRLPIRVEIDMGDDPETFVNWVDAQASVTATPDGLIWINGLAEGANNSAACLYYGNLWDYKHYSDGYITARNVRLNVAIPADHRVEERDFTDWDEDTLHPDFLGAFAWGRSLRVIDAGDAYQNRHQVYSFPSACEQAYGGTSGTTLQGDSTGITRPLPPGSENQHAVYAAKRALARRKNLKQNSRWMLMGIVTDLRGGDWIEKIDLVDAAGAVTEFPVAGTAESVTYDFVKPETVVGGVIGDYA